MKKRLKAILQSAVLYGIVVNNETTNGGGGFNMAAMMASMAVGSAVGQNIAGSMNNMMQGINQPSMGSVTPPPVPTVTYNVAVNGQATGPYDINILKQMAIAGQFKPNSLVWKPGMEAWSRADAVDDLKDLFNNVMPPIPTTECLYISLS